MPQVDYPRANWIRVAIRGQGIPAYLREDAFSVGLMALWNGDRQGFPPWQAAVHLKRRLIDFTRKETRRRETVGRSDNRAVVWVSRGECAIEAARHVAVDAPARLAADYFPSDWRGRLTERERLVLDRLYWHDTPAVELAAELGVTAGAIWQSKCQAIKKLRRLMAPQSG